MLLLALLLNRTVFADITGTFIIKESKNESHTRTVDDCVAHRLQ